MNGKNDKNKKKENENEGENEKKREKQRASSFRTTAKSKDRSLRFRLPTGSEESFSSAVSHLVKDDDEDTEDFTTPQVSILQKFVSSPLTHSQPRKAPKKQCISVSLDLGLTVLPGTSSQQLFEIVRSSPSPSDSDLHLLKATYLRKLDAVKEAINNGANVNTYTDRETPLLIATEIGDTRLVAYLLTVPNINPDFRNSFGQTPLIIAVRNAFDKIVRLLLSHNADVNLSDHMGKTPLHGAIIQQRKRLLKLLLAYGADVEKEDCFGERPIYTAAVKKPNIDCLVTLLKMGAAVNYVNFSGIPLLSRTILNGTDESIIKALVRHGASVNAQDLISKKTPLHFAALENKLRIVKYLISFGADVNLKTTYNFTAFDEAVFQNSFETAEYLRELTQAAKKNFNTKF